MTLAEAKRLVAVGYATVIFEDETKITIEMPRGVRMRRVTVYKEGHGKTT